MPTTPPANSISSSEVTGSSEPGSNAEYSNIGIGLLGHALALRAGVSYEDLLRRRILEPLGMTSTAITLNAEQRSRRATA